MSDTACNTEGGLPLATHTQKCGKQHHQRAKRGLEEDKNAHNTQHRRARGALHIPGTGVCEHSPSSLGRRLHHHHHHMHRSPTAHTARRTQHARLYFWPGFSPAPVTQPASRGAARAALEGRAAAASRRSRASRHAHACTCIACMRCMSRHVISKVPTKTVRRIPEPGLFCDTGVHRHLVQQR